MSKVLIFYTAHSIGHKRIAENLGYWFARLGWEVVMRDAFGVYAEDKSVGRFLRLHLFIYQRAAFLWRWLYNWGYTLFFPFRRLVARRYVPRVLQIIKDTSPDLVITTQTSPSAVLSVIKKQKLWRGKWAIGFSDYHFHPFWVYPGADGYLVNIANQQAVLVERGISSQAIATGGMWLSPRPLVNTEAVKVKLNIPPRAKLILVAAGSGGWVKFDSVLRALEKVVALGEVASQKITPILLCGRDQRSLENIRAVVPADWITLPFYQPLSDLYAIADLFLTKPGGLSIAEGLQWRLPCFIPFLLEGQENLNLTYLESLNLVRSFIGISENLWPELIYEELVSGQARQLLLQNSNLEKIIGENPQGKLSIWLNYLFHREKLEV